MKMNFIETIEGYIKAKSDNSCGTYGPRINAFALFLQKEKGVVDKNFKEILSAINTDIIIESLGDYIINNSIKKETAAYFYARTVKDYFYYLSSIGIENEHLMKEFAYKNQNSYERKIYSYIENNPKLKKVEAKEAVDFEEIKMLIVAIDEKIEEAFNSSEIFTCIKDKYNPFNDLAYLLGLKIMIFTGVDYGGLRTLKSDCVNVPKRKITINSYTIHLPDMLGDQLIKYVSVKQKREIQSDIFFVHSDGKSLAQQTSKMSAIINEIIQRQDSTGIRKYIIIEMIRKGINQSFIMQLSGVGQTMFEDCQRIVNEERHIEANRYIDSKIRDMIVFDYL